MGVFARLLRRSKTPEAPAAASGAETAKAGSEAEETAAAAEVTAAERASEAVEPTAKDTEVAESDGVDIPHQQSTDKAADNEAGDGART
ncbi:hypothetical protein [Streptomyces sp. NPDC058735]|uniref:hypothetical protein n=1 Tax=unclassified Streptomyces TaxID=2593676 RepID=UPI0036A8D863